MKPKKIVHGKYYVELHGNGCGIRDAKDLAQARRNALRESGTSNVKLVRPATEEDVSWVEGMGGNIGR